MVLLPDESWLSVDWIFSDGGPAQSVAARRQGLLLLSIAAECSPGHRVPSSMPSTDRPRQLTDFLNAANLTKLSSAPDAGVIRNGAVVVPARALSDE